MDEQGYTLANKGTEGRLITPEQQIRNVIGALSNVVFGDAHPGRMDAIRSTTLQLRDMWDEYQRGELAAIEDDGAPF